jgi:AcrR family transcriptional regulator
MNSTPTRKEITHDRIVKTAAGVIRRSGYDGMGVADIMKEAGLTHGGFYAHFDSRTQLLVEAVDRAAGDSFDSLRRVVGQGKPGEALNTLVDAYLSDEHVDHPEAGCTFSSLGTEMPRQAPEVRQVCGRRLKEMVDLVERQMPDWGEPGQHEKALGVLSCLVGAMVLARAAEDKRLSGALRKAAKTMIQQSIENGAA